MKYGRYEWSHICLSVGLGVTFAWIGVNMLTDPSMWIGYIPEQLPDVITRERALEIAGIFNITIGLLLILRWRSHIAATLASIHILSVIMLHGIDVVLIRDVGLLGASLALAVWPTTARKKPFWKKLPLLKRL